MENRGYIVMFKRVCRKTFVVMLSVVFLLQTVVLGMVSGAGSGQGLKRTDTLAPVTAFPTQAQVKEHLLQQWIEVMREVILPEAESIGLEKDPGLYETTIMRELLHVLGGVDFRGLNLADFVQLLEQYRYSTERQQKYTRWYQAFSRTDKDRKEFWKREGTKPDDFTGSAFDDVEALQEVWDGVPQVGKDILCRFLGIDREQVDNFIKEGNTEWVSHSKANDQLLKESVWFLGDFTRRNQEQVLYQGIRMALQRILIRSLTYAEGKNGRGRMPLATYFAKGLDFSDEELLIVAKDLSLPKLLRKKKGKLAAKARKRLLMAVSDELVFLTLTHTMPKGVLTKEQQQKIKDILTSKELDKLNGLSPLLSYQGSSPKLSELCRKSYLVDLPRVQVVINKEFKNKVHGAAIRRWGSRFLSHVGIKTALARKIEEIAIIQCLFEVVKSSEVTREVVRGALEQTEYQLTRKAQKKRRRKLIVTPLVVGFLIVLVNLSPVQSWFIAKEVDEIVALYFMLHPEHTIIDLLNNIKQGNKASVHILFHLSKEPRYQKLIMMLCLLFWREGRLSQDDEAYLLKHSGPKVVERLKGLAYKDPYKNDAVRKLFEKQLWDLISKGLKSKALQGYALTALRILFKSNQSLREEAQLKAFELLQSSDDLLRAAGLQLVLEGVLDKRLDLEDLLKRLEGLTLERTQDHRFLESVLIGLGFLTVQGEALESLVSELAFLKPHVKKQQGTYVLLYSLSREEIRGMLGRLLRLYGQLLKERSKNQKLMVMVQGLFLRFTQHTADLLYDTLRVEQGKDAAIYCQLLPFLGIVGFKRFLGNIRAEESSFYRKKTLLVVLLWYERGHKGFVGSPAHAECAQLLTNLLLDYGRYDSVLRKEIQRFLEAADPMVIKAMLNYVKEHYIDVPDKHPIFVGFAKDFLGYMMKAVARNQDSEALEIVFQDICIAVFSYVPLQQAFVEGFPADLKLLKVFVRAFNEQTKEARDKNTHLFKALVRKITKAAYQAKDVGKLKGLLTAVKTVQVSEAVQLAKNIQALIELIHYLPDLDVLLKMFAMPSSAREVVYKDIVSDKKKRDTFFSVMKGMIDNPKLDKETFTTYMEPCLEFMWYTVRNCPLEDRGAVYKTLAELFYKYVSKTYMYTGEHMSGLTAPYSKHSKSPAHYILEKKIKANPLLDIVFLEELLMRNVKPKGRHAHGWSSFVGEVMKKIAKEADPQQGLALIARTVNKDLWHIRAMTTCMKRLTPQEFVEIGKKLVKEGHKENINWFADHLGKSIYAASQYSFNPYDLMSLDKSIFPYVEAIVRESLPIDHKAAFPVALAVIVETEDVSLHEKVLEILKQEINRPYDSYQDIKEAIKSKEKAVWYLGYIKGFENTFRARVTLKILNKFLKGKTKEIYQIVAPDFFYYLDGALLRLGAVFSDLDHYLQYLDKRLVKRLPNDFTGHHTRAYMKKTTELIESLGNQQYRIDSNATEKYRTINVKILQWAFSKLLALDIENLTYVRHDNNDISHYVLISIRGLISRIVQRERWGNDKSREWIITQLRGMHNWRLSQYKANEETILQYLLEGKTQRALQLIQTIGEHPHPLILEIERHLTLKHTLEIKVIDLLREKIKKKDLDISFELDLIGVLRYKRAYPELIKIAQDQTHPYRYLAIKALGRLGDQRCVALLQKILNEPMSAKLDKKALLQLASFISPEVLEGILVLARSKPDQGAKELLTLVLDNLGIKDRSLLDSVGLDKIMSLQALAAFKDMNVVADIKKALESPSPYVRYWALDTLSRLHGKDVLSHARQLLKDPCLFVRVRALDTIGQLGNKDDLEKLRKQAVDWPEPLQFPADLVSSSKSIDLMVTMLELGDAILYDQVIGYIQKHLSIKDNKKKRQVSVFSLDLLDRLRQVIKRKLLHGAQWKKIAPLTYKGEHSLYADHVVFLEKLGSKISKDAFSSATEWFDKFFGRINYGKEDEAVRFLIQRWLHFNGLTPRKEFEKLGEGRDKEMWVKSRVVILDYFIRQWYSIHTLRFGKMDKLEGALFDQIPDYMAAFPDGVLRFDVFLKMFSAVMRDMLWKYPQEGISTYVRDLLRKDECKLKEIIISLGLCPDLPDIDDKARERLVVLIGKWFGQPMEKSQQAYSLSEMYSLFRLISHYKLVTAVGQEAVSWYALEVIKRVMSLQGQKDIVIGPKRVELVLNCISSLTLEEFVMVMNDKRVDFLTTQARKAFAYGDAWFLYRMFSKMKNVSEAKALRVVFQKWLGDGTVLLKNLHLMPILQELGLLNKELLTRVHAKAQTPYQKHTILMARVLAKDKAVFEEVVNKTYAGMFKFGQHWKAIIHYIWGSVSQGGLETYQEFLRSKTADMVLKDMAQYLATHPKVLHDKQWIKTVDQAIVAMVKTKKVPCTIFNDLLRKAVEKKPGKVQKQLLMSLGTSGEEKVLPVVITYLERRHKEAPKSLTKPLKKFMAVSQKTLLDKGMVRELNLLGESMVPEIVPLLKDLILYIERCPVHEGLVVIINRWIQKAQNMKKDVKEKKSSHKSKSVRKSWQEIESSFQCAA